MEDGDIRKPKKLPSGPESWIGPENWKNFNLAINSVVFFGPAFLFFVVLSVGNYFFSDTTAIQKNALGELLMQVPRIDFDVEMFRNKGGVQYGQKCLFLWELLALCLIPCFLADIWLFDYVTKGLNYRNMGKSDLPYAVFCMAIFALVLFGFFWSRFSLYGGGRRGLPVNAFMFWFAGLNMLIANMLVFFFPFYIYLHGKMNIRT